MPLGIFWSPAYCFPDSKADLTGIFQGVRMSGVVVPIEGGRSPKAGVEALVKLVRPDMERVNAIILAKAG